MSVNTTVGSSGSAVGTKEALIGTVGFKGTTMDSSDVDAMLQSKHVTLGEKSATIASSVDVLQSTDDTLGSNMILQSNTDTLGSQDDSLGSQDDSLGSNDDALGSNDDALGSSTTLQSNSFTLGSNSVAVESNDDILGSNDDSLGSNDATLVSNDATLGSKDATVVSVAATLESEGATVISTGACETAEGSNIQVSVIIPVYNGAKWLDECLQAISDQDFHGTLEISVFDDNSTDNSREIAESWRAKMRMRGVTMVISGHNTGRPRGVGFAKNKAVAQSSGQYLCFQDALYICSSYESQRSLLPGSGWREVKHSHV